MFTQSDIEGIYNAVMAGVDNAMDLQTEYDEVDAARQNLGVVEFALEDRLVSAINALVAEAAEQAFLLGFQAGQRPASLLGLVVAEETNASSA